MPTDPTPIPADPPMEVLRAARKWASEHRHQTPDDRLVGLAFAAGLSAGLAAGRTAAAADALADEVARAAVAWRSALVTEGVDVGEVEGALFQLAERYEGAMAARVAENGAAAHSCSNCEGVDPASCAMNRGADQ